MSFLDVLRKQKEPVLKETSGRAIPVSFNTWQFKTYDDSLLTLDTTLACIDVIARHTAKVKLHPVIVKDGISNPDTTSDIAKVLQRPNDYMTPYDFLYKTTALLLSSDNAFIYPEYEKGHLKALWPIAYESFQLLKGNDGQLYASFRLNYFRSYTCPYESLIHLRQHYVDDDLFGDAHEAIKPVCALIDTQNKGIVNSIKNSAIIRGILKATGVLKEEDLTKARERFIKDNLAASNNGGVMVVDGKFDYKQLESKPYVIDSETMNTATEKVYNYFHVNKAFIESSFTPDEYEAVYEGVLEPLATLITQALTMKLYTERERAFGNRIELRADIHGTSTANRIVKIIQATSQLGLFTRDEYREMLGYSPLGEALGGNEIMVAVNNYQAAENTDDQENEDDEEKDI